MERKNLYYALHRQAAGIGHIAVSGILRLLKDAIADVQNGNAVCSNTRSAFKEPISSLIGGAEKANNTHTILHPSLPSQEYSS